VGVPGASLVLTCAAIGHGRSDQAALANRPIGRRRAPVADALARRGFMATSATKVIDNAIIGFMQSR